MSNFFYLFLFSIIGAALMFAVTWLRQGKDFDPKSQIAFNAVALGIGGLAAYFIDQPAVQAAVMVSLQVTMVSTISAVMKIGKTDQMKYDTYGFVSNQKKSANWLGYLLVILFVIGWVFIVTAETVFEKHQTLAEWIGYGSLVIFAVICAGGFFAGWFSKK